MNAQNDSHALVLWSSKRGGIGGVQKAKAVREGCDGGFVRGWQGVSPTPHAPGAAPTGQTCRVGAGGGGDLVQGLQC